MYNVNEFGTILARRICAHVNYKEINLKIKFFLNYLLLGIVFIFLNLRIINKNLKEFIYQLYPKINCFKNKFARICKLSRE